MPRQPHPRRRPRRPGLGRRPGRRPHAAAERAHARHQAAAAVRQHARALAHARSAATTTAARRGRGARSRSASTSARTSTRRSTGSPAATARTWPACRAGQLVGPAVVIDRSGEAAADPDYLLTVDDVRAFEAEHGAAARGRLAAAAHRLGRAGARRGGVPQRAGRAPRTPGAGRRVRALDGREEPARRLRLRDRRAPTRARRGGFDPPFPAHNFLLGAGKYGITQLANLRSCRPPARCSSWRR